MNTYNEGDLVLFPTKKETEDFRARFKKHYTDPTIDITDTFRTIHSFIINSTKHIKNGGSYNKLIIDEALMNHADEVLFVAALARAPEIILVGDANQIP